MDRLIKPARMAFFVFFIAVIIVIYGINLYKLQIVEGAEYYERSQNSIVTTSAITASRGNILDRYGRLLVSNRPCTNLVINEQEMFYQGNDSNRLILELVEVIEEAGETWNDLLPITAEPPFEYIPNMTEFQKSMVSAYIDENKKKYDLDDNATAVDLMASFRKRYDIDNNYDAAQMRTIAGVRFMCNVSHLVNYDYIFADDVGINLIATLMEGNYPGFEVEVSYAREYKSIYASHLIGYTGKISPEEFEKFKDLGYPMDAYVGKDGAEKAFEEYLHGRDGEAVYTATQAGTVTGTHYNEVPEPGDHVYLTLDIALQEVGEQALARGIEGLNEKREADNKMYESLGERSMIMELATGGSLVVVDIPTGEPLCIANYPSFDLATLFEDYEEISTDENKPLFNRSLQGEYAPGSTFKMVTSIACLNEGVIGPSTPITDEGIFTKYGENGGYQPKCWIYDKGATHGDVDMVGALAGSCNYYFYTVSDQLGIDKMADYAARFGLGEPTGIELPENLGMMSSREKKMELEGTDWWLGDTLQAGIGQMFSQFTPLQIASYVATVANDGVRYSNSILKTVRSYDYSETVYNREPEVLSEVGGQAGYYDVVKQGMRGVASYGTAMTYLADYPIPIAAKTGTAQMGGDKVNNAVFVCFAPYDDPQIAVAVVMERGDAGSSMAAIAREVLDYYFYFESSGATMETENSLLK